jgi:hypothetical protein
MWLSMILVALLLITTYYQSIQGATSAIFMAVLSALCAGIAFGTFEAVAEATLFGVAPEYAYPAAFIAMFVIPLAIFRFALDSWIQRANLLPNLVDRIVGGTAGFCSGFIITGVLATGLQMVPWPGIIGYSRFNNESPSEQNELWLRPDRAMAHFATFWSDGILGGENSLAAKHPDFISTLGGVQAAVLGVRRTAPREALQLEEASPIDFVYNATAPRGARRQQDPTVYDQVEPRPGHEFLRVIIKLSGSIEELGDPDKTIHYAPAAVRLVGTENEVPAVYYGIAAPDDDNPNYLIRSFKRDEEANVAGLTLSVAANNIIEVAFEVPNDFVPREVQYKLGASAPFRKTSSESPPPPEPATASAPTPAPRPGGRVSGVKFRSSHFGDDMPLTMTAYQGIDTENRGETLEQGHLTGLLADQGKTNSNESLSKFEVPAGKALLQLNVESLQAGSLLGKALNQAATTVEDYNIEDDNGTSHGPVGKYAIAKVGNDQIVEIMYFPEYAASGARAIRPFSRIKHTHLKGDYQLVYLYIVDSGTRVVRFDPGGNKRKTDLSGDNLVAP